MCASFMVKLIFLYRMCNWNVCLKEKFYSRGLKGVCYLTKATVQCDAN